MRIFKSAFFMLAIVLLLTGCINIPIGDGNKMKISKDGITFTDEEGGQHSITIDEEEGQVSMKGFGMDGEDEEISVGQNLDIPNSFPTDIPIPDNANIVQASSIQSVTTISFTTTIDIEQIVDLYESYLNSGILVAEPNVMDFQGEGSINKMYSGERKDGQLSIVIDGSIEREYDTKVQISFSEEQLDE